MFSSSLWSWIHALAMGPPEVEIMTAILLHPISPALSQEASGLCLTCGLGDFSFLSVFVKGKTIQIPSDVHNLWFYDSNSGAWISVSLNSPSFPPYPTLPLQPDQLVEKGKPQSSIKGDKTSLNFIFYISAFVFKSNRWYFKASIFPQHNISTFSILIAGISNELNLSCSGEEGKGTGCGSTGPT